MSKHEERKKWFTDRIGKRVYRGSTSCECPICNDVAKIGLIIEDEFHAEYLMDVEGAYRMDGHDLRYVDSLEELNNYEK